MISAPPSWLAAISENANNALAYTWGNCTRFVAAALSWIPAGLGNANQWLANAQEKGLPTIGPNATPPPGAVAVWNTGAFGHVAEVVGNVPGGFQVAEENFLGLGQRDIRTVTGSGLKGLLGFILPPGSASTTVQGTAPLSVGLNTAEAVAGLPASVGHGLANAATATTHNLWAWLQNWLPALIVALIVAYVLYGEGGSGR